MIFLININLNFFLLFLIINYPHYFLLKFFLKLNIFTHYNLNLTLLP